MIPLVYHPHYVTPLPHGHRFPMGKFAVLRDLLVEEGIASVSNLHEPPPATRTQLLRVHTPDYVDAFTNGTLGRDAVRRIGLPWSEGLVRRTVTAVGGTVRTAELALEHGLACNLAGGTHHAHPGFGSGFCIFNDLAVAAADVRHRGLARRVLVVDLDVHQGDGTAAALAERDDVFTFSMHCGANFPSRKVAGDHDVALDTGVGDGRYLEVLADALPAVLTRVKPDLVLYDAGVDPHRDDRLGRLELSDGGLARRDRQVIDLCRDAGAAVAGVIGGGYHADLRTLADRHATLHRAAAARWAKEHR